MLVLLVHFVLKTNNEVDITKKVGRLLHNVVVVWQLKGYPLVSVWVGGARNEASFTFTSRMQLRIQFKSE